MATSKRSGLAKMMASIPAGSCDCGDARPILRIAAPPPHVVSKLDPGTLALTTLGVSAKASAGAGCCGSGGGGGSMGLRDWIDVESDMKIDPIGTLGRWLRFYLLGGVIANGVLTFNPQRTFLPMKLFAGSGTGGNTIARLQSGINQYFATTDPIVQNLFLSPNYDTHELRPLVTEVGEKITAIVSGGTDNWCLFGFDLDDQCMLSRRRGALMPVGFSQSFATATTADIIIQTQKSMRLRRLAIDSTASGFAGCLVNSFYIGNEPQFESGDGVPIEVFSALAPNLFMDGDVLEVGAQAKLNITVTANGGAATVISGFFEGDTGY
jgi:hypothetical protein